MRSREQSTSGKVVGAETEARGVGTGLGEMW